MTDNEIERLAQRVAKLIINNLHEVLLSGLNEWDCLLYTSPSPRD